LEILSNLFDSNYQIILNKTKNDLEFLYQSNWCNSENFYISGNSNRNIEEIIEKSDQVSIVLQKMNAFESFTNHLTYKNQNFIAGFLSVMNSNGKKAGFLIKVKESKEISEIHDTFTLNSTINILITSMLIILIISYNNAQGRIKEIKMFDAMVVTANHEIKQPLSIITGYIEILVNDDNIDKKTKIKLRKIWANADKINYILEKLKNIEDPEYVDYANFTKMIDIENKNKSSFEG
jgi:nitrogen-specific signal transduction histidine kinase